jgi:hypothetical protein
VQQGFDDLRVRDSMPALVEGPPFARGLRPEVVIADAQWLDAFFDQLGGGLLGQGLLPPLRAARIHWTAGFDSMGARKDWSARQSGKARLHPAVLSCDFKVWSSRIRALAAEDRAASSFTSTEQRPASILEPKITMAGRPEHHGPMRGDVAPLELLGSIPSFSLAVFRSLLGGFVVGRLRPEGALHGGAVVWPP